MPVIHSIQMFEDGDDRSAMPMPEFAQWADDVRLFTADAELIVQVQFDDTSWRITGSDHFDWYKQSDESFRNAYEAIEYALALMLIPVSELEEAM